MRGRSEQHTICDTRQARVKQETLDILVGNKKLNVTSSNVLYILSRRGGIFEFSRLLPFTVGEDPLCADQTGGSIYQI